MSFKNRSFQFNRLEEFEKSHVVYHTVAHFFDGKNPLRTRREGLDFLDRTQAFADRHGVGIMDGGVMDNHIHMLLDSPEGPMKISDLWKSTNLSLVQYARKKSIEGKLLTERIQYFPVSDPFETIVVARYINNNGNTDGHGLICNLVNEFLYKNPRRINFGSWNSKTGLGLDDLKIIMACKDEELFQILKRYDAVFKKHAHLFKRKSAK